MFSKMTYKYIGQPGSQWGTHSNTIALFIILLIRDKNDSYVVTSNDLQKEPFDRLFCKLNDVFSSICRLGNIARRNICELKYDTRMNK